MCSGGVAVRVSVQWGSGHSREALGVESGRGKCGS